MERNLFRKAITLLKKLPVDFGQYEVRHTTKGKRILLDLLGDGTGMTALDLGCRDQFWSKKLEMRGYQVVSADLAPQNDSVRRVDANERLPFASRSFDLVWCTEVIEHVENPAFTLSEIRRVLTPGGVLLLTTPNSQFWLFRLFRALGIHDASVQNEDHRQFFRYADMVKLLGRCRLLGYFPLFYRRTLTKAFSLLSPTIVVRYQSSPAFGTIDESSPALSRQLVGTSS